MENTIQHKVQQAENIYLTNRQYIEKEIEVLLDEKRMFLRRIEQTADRIRTSVIPSENPSMPNITSVYRILEQAQDEGQHVVKKILYSLEDKLEENQRHYRKQLANYDEEQQKLKKKAGE